VEQQKFINQQLKQEALDKMVKINIDEDVKKLLLRVKEIKELDKALMIGNRIYKLNKLQRSLEDFLGVRNV
jgi:hypothetical protein